MKTHLKYLCLSAVLALAGGGMVTSCTTPTAQKVVALADIGLKVAAAKGWVAPGDNILIADALTAIVTPADGTTKTVKLASIGLDAAVSKRLLEPGDKVIIADAVNALVTPVHPPPVALPLVANSQSSASSP